MPSNSSRGGGGTAAPRVFELKLLLLLLYELKHYPFKHMHAHPYCNILSTILSLCTI